MRCLVAVEEAADRDAMVAAIEAFGVIDVDCVDLESTRTVLRRRKYEFGIVSLKSGSRESELLWQEIRSVAPDLALVALTPRAAMKVRKTDRARFSLFAMLGTPANAVETYSTLRRLMDRLTKTKVSPRGAVSSV